MRLDPQKTVLNLGYLGKQSQIKVYWNLSAPQLIEQSIINKEGNLSPTGALLVNTGEFTGRSPNDKFIVNYKEEADKEIDWGKVNQPFLPEKFDCLLEKVLTHLENKKVYVQDVLVGTNNLHQRRVRVITEFAWSALFARDLLIPGTDMYADGPDFTIIQAPSFCADPLVDGTRTKTFILMDFVKRIVLIGNTHYAGEIKKAVFTIMNRLLPGENVLPMHCSANIGMQGDTALFFGLSGTGKTTLSSDPDRILIGDDEHGWAKDGVFNFEGGCYAKTINLKKDLEPIIWDASQSFGSVLENVTFDPETRLLDFTDSSVTENTRAAYALQNVARRAKSGMGGHPEHIFFLSADAFGVLPPISSLTPNQAAYYFLSGYTAKLAGTERGLGCEPQATFSACFGAPFMPLNPVKYANMLREKIFDHHSKVWLVNTGWTGGPYGIGSRIKLPYTRAIISAAIKGILDEAPSEFDPLFGLKIPSIIPGVPAKMLNPIKNWENSENYYQMAELLIQKFRQNIEQYNGTIESDLLTQL
ncbi:MAG: phosphoenolpyruvate carboxykinase (ATP) [Anaerolinea sp.]|nr:phosphoenolpyruvate carboxykinase (ATP) [Anaerolinea sp.]